VQEPRIDGPNRFGNRFVVSADGKQLFLTLGERFRLRSLELGRQCFRMTYSA
jgi:hypothetical protein